MAVEAEEEAEAEAEAEAEVEEAEAEAEAEVEVEVEVEAEAAAAAEAEAVAPSLARQTSPRTTSSGSKCWEHAMDGTTSSPAAHSRLSCGYSRLTLLPAGGRRGWKGRTRTSCDISSTTSRRTPSCRSGSTAPGSEASQSTAITRCVLTHLQPRPPACKLRRPPDHTPLTRGMPPPADSPVQGRQ